MKTKCSVSNERHRSLADTFPFPPRFPRTFSYCNVFAGGENVINMAAPYSKQQRLTLFTMDVSVCCSSCGVKEKATVHHE